MSRVFRVLTLNIWNLNQWAARRDEVVAWIDRLAPDVVCLQEVIDDDTGRNQARWIASAAAGEWDVAYDGAAVPWRPGGRFGNAVLSREAITATATCWLPYVERSDDVQRLALHARCGNVDVYSTHLSWRFEDGVVREAQVRALAGFVASTASTASADSPLPPVIGGDFNAEPDSTEIRFLSGLTSMEGESVYFQDAWRVAGGGGAGPGWTWDNRNPFAASALEPDRRIDYIFVGWRRDSGAGRVESCRVVCDRALGGTYATDHYGLVADLAR